MKRWLAQRLALRSSTGTYCHLLWDSAFVDPHGNVYACCHSQPGVLGNVHEESMEAIWGRSEALRRYRELSESGRLHCAPGCNILSPREKAGLDRPPTYADHPRNLWILYGERCNVACIMCPQDHRSDVVLDRAALERNVCWKKVEQVELQGGEILAMRGARELYLWLTESTAAKVNVITNGLLVDEEWARRMVRAASWVQVSVNAASKPVHELVNAGSTFEKAIAGLERLVRAKRQQAASAEVVFKYTIVPENLHEIPDGVALADELGCDWIAFGFDRSVPGFLAAHADLAERLRRRLALTLKGDLSIGVERKRLDMLGLLPAA